MLRYKILGSLARSVEENNKSLYVSGKLLTNLYGRIQDMEFKLRCNISGKLVSNLVGAASGTPILIDGFVIGTDIVSNTGVALIESVTVLGKMPTVRNNGEIYLENGINFATLNGSVASEPIIEKFKDDQCKTTFLVKYNKRSHKIKVVTMGRLANDLQKLQVGDRVNLVGHILQNLSIDPLGRELHETYFETIRSDIEAAEKYEERMSRPRMPKKTMNSPQIIAKPQKNLFGQEVALTSQPASTASKQSVVADAYDASGGEAANGVGSVGFSATVPEVVIV